MEAHTNASKRNPLSIPIVWAVANHHVLSVCTVAGGRRVTLVGVKLNRA